jgi:hypothetical protein
MDILRKLRALALALRPHPSPNVASPRDDAPARTDNLPASVRNSAATGAVKHSAKDNLDEARVAELLENQRRQ